MKFFANKNIWKKLIIIFLFINIVSFTAPKPVSATLLGSIGGTLMEPICDFIIVLGDGAVNIMHKVLVQQDYTIVPVDLGDSGLLKAVFGVLAAAAVLVAVGALTFGVGALLGAIGIAASVSVGTVVACVVGSIYVGYAVYNSEYFNEELDLPMYQISPEEIFKNQVPLFNVNFFNNKKTYYEPYSSNNNIVYNKMWDSDQGLSNWGTVWDNFEAASELVINNVLGQIITQNEYIEFKEDDISFSKLKNSTHHEEKKNKKEADDTWDCTYYFCTRHNDNKPQGLHGTIILKEMKSGTKRRYRLFYNPAAWIYNLSSWSQYDNSTDKKLCEITSNDDGGLDSTASVQKKTSINGNVVESTLLDEIIDYYLYFDSGFKITLNQMKQSKKTERTSTATIYYLEKDQGYYKLVYGDDNKAEVWFASKVSEEEGKDKIETYSSQLSGTIATWYYRILIMAIVGMLSVLVYIGIRITISSASSQKAKYKQMLVDWFVGMVLLFTMHLIMIFANEFVDNITEYIGSFNQSGQVQGFPMVDKDGDNAQDKFKEALKDNSYYVSISEGENFIPNSYYMDTENNMLYWRTNLMGVLRINTRYAREDSERYVGYTIMYVTLVIFFISIIFTYIKRLIYMAFLTIIAPLVALTYPIDKANDGQAQGFNMWLKEYIFNLLLQPVHLLLYTILMSSAIELAVENPIYGIVCIGFIIPAEKILRQLFNFSKAHTPGVLGGAVGGAMTMSAIRWITGKGPGGGGPDRGGKSGVEKDQDGKIISSTGEHKIRIASNNTRNANTSGTQSTNTQNNSRTQSRNNMNSQTMGGQNQQPDNVINFAERKKQKESSTMEEQSLQPDMVKNIMNYDERKKQKESSTIENDGNDVNNSNDELNDRNIRMDNQPIFDTNNIDTVDSESDMDQSIFKDVPEDTNLRFANNEDNFESNSNDWTANLANAYGRNAINNSNSYSNTKEGKEQKNNTNRLKGKKGQSKLVRATSNALGAYKDGMVRKIKGAKVDPIGKLGRIGAGMAAGMALGTIGLAAGAATGDAGKAAQYAAGAAAGGYKLGSKTQKAAARALSVDGVEEQFKRSWHGEEEYERIQAKKNQDAAKKDERNIKKLQEKYKIDRKEAKEKLSDMIPFYYDNKVTDIDDIIKMEKVADTYKGINREDARKNAYIGYHLNNQYNISGKTGKSDRAKISEQMQNDYGWSETEAKKFLKYADKFNQISNNM